MGLEDDFNQLVELTVSAEVGGETITCMQRTLAGVYNDPDARKALEEALRQSLMTAILKKWSPVIKVRR